MAGPDGKITTATLRARKGGGKGSEETGGEKVAVLTAYDVVFARLADEAGIDIVLVGDSLGMVVQGDRSTLAVTLDDMVYHTRIVARGVRRAHLVADMPFMSYQASVEDGMRAAGRLMKEGHAEAVKLEGGVEIAELVHKLVRAGIPVMGHVGLTPQSVHQLGGFKIETVPQALAADITRSVSALTIGIGAGPDCDGQVMVMHDLLGLEPAWKPRFVRRYAELGKASAAAFAAYAADVKAGKFPGPQESFD